MLKENVLQKCRNNYILTQTESQTLTGTLSANTWANRVQTADGKYASRYVGRKTYELKDHLGNVRVTLSDALAYNANTSGMDAQVKSYTNYYPFGMMQHTNSSMANNSYRFGFQGQEMDNEVKGTGNMINYKYRVHDVRIGRFLSIDPLTASYPHYSPYSFSGNRVIDAFELEGLEPVTHTTQKGDTYSSVANQYGVSVDQLREHNSWADTKIPIGADMNIADPNSWQFPDDLQKWENAGANIAPGDLGQHPALLNADASEAAFDIIQSMQTKYNPMNFDNYSSFGLNSFSGKISNRHLDTESHKYDNFLAIKNFYFTSLNANLSISGGIMAAGMGGSGISSLRSFGRQFLIKGGMDALGQGVVLSSKGESLLKIDVANSFISGMGMPGGGSDFLSSFIDLRLNGEFVIKPMDQGLAEFGLRRYGSLGKPYLKNSYQKLGYDLLNKYYRGELMKSYRSKNGN